MLSLAELRRLCDAAQLKPDSIRGVSILTCSRDDVMAWHDASLNHAEALLRVAEAAFEARCCDMTMPGACGLCTALDAFNGEVNRG